METLFSMYHEKLEKNIKNDMHLMEKHLKNSRYLNGWKKRTGSI